MLIGLISDTHDKLPGIDTALDLFKSAGAGLVVHCGDWKSLATVRYFAEKAADLNLPVRGVLGNNDRETASFMDFAETAPGDFRLEEGISEFETGGRLVAVYHGHHRPTLSAVRSEAYDIICLGHTHKPIIEHSGPALIVNPGSTAFSIPRSAAWRPSVAVLDTDTLTAEIIYP
jgi:putative phosphoesterase